MLSRNSALARASVLICTSIWFGQAATIRDEPVPGPLAIATKAEVNYCFARVRGLDPERLPPAYLVLQLFVTVSYRNSGTRPLILPLEHERTVYTALKQGEMKAFKEGLGLSDPVPKPLEALPPDVSPNSPVDPKNDFFVVIPAGGEMTPPLVEEITLPVNRKGVLRNYPDLRGRSVYVKLRYMHRKIDATLQAHLSDQWSRFGVPWTGTLTTNTILIEVPASPQAAPCKDKYTPAHQVVAADDKK